MAEKLTVNQKQRVLVTGATGFVGRALCTSLLADNYFVRGAVWRDEQLTTSNLPASVESVYVDSLGPNTNWSMALAEIDIVIHLAARVHIMDDYSVDPLMEFRRVNTEGTVKLAQDAVTAGVKRMIFVSSIKVNGEETDIPYAEDSPNHPTDPYGFSKWEAEQALREIESNTGIEVVILRPTLVYGPGVKANFLNMLRAVKRGLPLPFSSIVNQRSLIYIGNLVDALVICTIHSKAAGQTYLLSDGEDVSTPELIRRAAMALDVPVKLLPFPVSLMRFVGRLTGKRAAINRLTGSLTVDSSKIRRELGWQPPFAMEEGLQSTAQWFMKTCF